MGHGKPQNVSADGSPGNTNLCISWVRSRVDAWTCWWPPTPLCLRLTASRVVSPHMTLTVSQTSFIGSPVDPLTEDIETLGPISLSSQRCQGHARPRELGAAWALAKQASTPEPRADAGTRIQAHGWLFLPVFAQQVLATTLVALRIDHLAARALTEWLASRGLHTLNDLWGACGLTEPDAESPSCCRPFLRTSGSSVGK